MAAQAHRAESVLYHRADGCTWLPRRTRCALLPAEAPEWGNSADILKAGL